MRWWRVLIFCGALAPLHADTIVPGLVSATGAAPVTLLPVNLNGFSDSVPVVWLERWGMSVPDTTGTSGTNGTPVSWLAGSAQYGQYGVNYGSGPGTAAVATNWNTYVRTGTVVNSYLLWSYRGTAQADIIIEGTLVFDRPIIGIITGNTQVDIRPGGGTTYYRYLAGSDAGYGYLPPRSYPTTEYRGMDIVGSFRQDEWFTLVNDHTLFYHLYRTPSSYDNVRILTATPEPAAVVFGATVALLLAGTVYRRRRRRIASAG